MTDTENEMQKQSQRLFLGPGNVYGQLIDLHLPVCISDVRFQFQNDSIYSWNRNQKIQEGQEYTFAYITCWGTDVMGY